MAIQRDPFHVLVAGGSYAGLAAILNLLDLCNGHPCRFSASTKTAESFPRIPVRITLVDERDGFYHLIGAPLALASMEYAEKAWTKFTDIPALQTPAIKLVQGSVVTIDPLTKTATISEHGTRRAIHKQYDYFIAASGLRRQWPTVPRSLKRDDYVAEVKMHLQQLDKASHGVTVIGGGAVGIEIASELKLVQPHQSVTLIHSRPKLLSSEALPDETKDRALSLIHDAGVKTIMSTRVTKIEQAESESEATQLTLSDGSVVKTGLVINAISKYTPTATYLPDNALDEGGYVKIHPNLQLDSDIPNAEYHYAAGDIASWAGIKRCGAAMHHGHYAAVNIHQMMLHSALGTNPQLLQLNRDVPPMIGLAVGSQAVSYSPSEGTAWGEDVAKLYFGDDLGFEICWNYMQLSKAAENPSDPVNP